MFPRLERDGTNLASDHHSGVVKEDIGAAVLGQDLLTKGSHRLLVRQVCVEKMGCLGEAQVDGGSCLLPPRSVYVCQEDERPQGSKGQGGFPANPSTRAGEEDGVSGEGGFVKGKIHVTAS